MNSDESRRTAQEHLDYWLGVLRDTDTGTVKDSNVVRNANREVRFWRRMVRAEYRRAQR